MRTVYKYGLGIVDGPQKVMMPLGAEVVFVGAQGSTLVLWADVITTNLPAERLFVVHGTGHQIDPDVKHVGTVQMPRFVWHVFEVLP